MAHTDKPQDKDIGRPGPWGESRYTVPGNPAGQSVLTPPGTSPSEDGPVSTPVTRKDYEFPGAETNKDADSPGGDAG
jgi:hypothetical protein